MEVREATSPEWMLGASTDQLGDAYRTMDEGKCGKVVIVFDE